MRTRISPLMALTLLLVVALPLVSCSDGGGGNGGVTGPTPTPAIAIALGASTLSVTPGNDNTLTVNVTRSGGFTGVVNLTLEGAPAGVTGTFSPAAVPADASSSTLTISASGSAAPGSHGLSVRATGSGVTAQTASLSLTVEVPPSIAVAIDPDSLQIDQGASGQVAVTLDRTNFTGNVALALEGAPSGVTGTFDPAVLSGEAGGSTLTIEVGEDADVGEHEITIRASADGVDDGTAILSLDIADAPGYTLTLDPTSLAIPQGADGAVSIQLERINFAGPVALSVDGVPSGVTASISPASVDGDEATLTMDVGAEAAPGSVTITVTGTADGLDDRTADLDLTVIEVGSFTLGITPSTIEMEQGETETATLEIARDAGFTGVVDITVSGAPTGLDVTVDPASVAGSSAAVTVDAAADLEAGTYEVTLEGSGEVAPGQTHVDAVTLTVAVAEALTGDWVQISSGGAHTCAINEVGEAYCWGNNPDGRLGDGTNTARLRPRLVTGGHTWASITAGWIHTCGITTDGQGFCWGAGGSGRLGNGSTANSSVPEPIAVTDGDTWQILSAGYEHTCGVAADGTGYCWGRNNTRQLGDGSSSNRTTRSPIAGDHVWQTVSAAGANVGGLGRSFSCGLTIEGEAYCWGSRINGALGDGSSSGTAAIPQLVQGGFTWTDVRAQSIHSCGITTAGNGYCWGSNGSGQLGVGDVAHRNTPTLVLNDHDWRDLKPGWTNTTCGITQAGVAYCWGLNDTGQVGDATTGNKTAPQPVAGGFTWLPLISGGGTHTCGVTEAGVAYCWGRGTSGQLGNGSSASTIYRTPLKVLDPQ
jgi:alpha-tubulin suppressor-like RCC1 family protein